MSNFNEGRVPEEPGAVAPPDLSQDRVCQTCRWCVWEDGNKCGREGATAGLGIIPAYRLCRGKSWEEQEWRE